MLHYPSTHAHAVPDHFTDIGHFALLHRTELVGYLAPPAVPQAATLSACIPSWAACLSQLPATQQLQAGSKAMLQCVLHCLVHRHTDWVHAHRHWVTSVGERM